ncbi:hypothetical protein Leryth_026424 [Lithospermum erythrorhizon]|uniref:C2 domain-containing protein n=1 Tax=Lithospermum erythrorhizon TaxID=34254 RepID=A0AAV3R9L8_LITER|nr:hypothetical protein Leryth_026424 [Lithospermum erythrorhizon]
MEPNVKGLVRIRVRRGINLAVRDLTTLSDPYIVFTMGLEKVKTHVVKDDSNPEWNADLAMHVKDPNVPISLSVFDKDNVTLDDKLGDAEFDIRTLVRCMKKGTEALPDGTNLDRVEPSSDNHLADTSYVIWQNGKMVQEMRLKLRNIECGEVEIQVEWVDLTDASAYKILE